MRAVFKDVGKTAEIIDIPGDDFEHIQKLLGGVFEAVYQFDDRFTLFANEEGKFNGMLPHIPVPHDVIFGPVLIVGIADRNGDSTELTPELAAVAVQKLERSHLVLNLVYGE